MTSFSFFLANIVLLLIEYHILSAIYTENFTGSRASALIVKIMKDNIKTGKQPSAKKEGSLLATVLIGGAIGVALAWLFS